MCNCDKNRLAGAKFALINCDGKHIACGVTDCKGEILFDCLPLGKYFIKEIEAPCGYEKSCECIEVCITCDGKNKCVEFVNVRQSGSIKVIKIGKDC